MTTSSRTDGETPVNPDDMPLYCVTLRLGRREPDPLRPGKKTYMTWSETSYVRSLGDDPAAVTELFAEMDGCDVLDTHVVRVAP